MARGTASARSARAGSFRWRSAMGLDKLEGSPRAIFHPEIQKGSVNFKFGVLYAKDCQLPDDEIFSNGKDSRVLVVRLSAARKDTETKKILRSKYDCGENKLERTKGVFNSVLPSHPSEPCCTNHPTNTKQKIRPCPSRFEPGTLFPRAAIGVPSVLTTEAS